MNLVTESQLPDSEALRVFGVDTSAIDDAERSAARLDRFGILRTAPSLLEGSLPRRTSR